MTFDLKLAREALSRATERLNVATDIYHLADLTYLPAALDEIERQAKRIAEPQHFSDDLMGHCNALRSRAQKAEARIAELEKTLVEERARRLHRENGSLRCDHYGSPECEEAWQNFCDFAGCPHQKDFVKLAHEQLRQEEKL